jgi:hypothetical protein
MNTRASARKTRTPVNGRNILTVTGKEPGYVYRVVNMTGDRVQQFLDAGYEVVNANDIRVGDRRVDAATPEGSMAQVVVNKSEGQKAVVMRIKDEWYKEDQVLKQQEVARLEQSITETLSGKTDKNPADYGKLQISRD